MVTGMSTTTCADQMHDRCLLQIPVDGYAASYKVPLLYDREDES